MRFRALSVVGILTFAAACSSSEGGDPSSSTTSGAGAADPTATSAQAIVSSAGSTRQLLRVNLTPEMVARAKAPTPTSFLPSTRKGSIRGLMTSVKDQGGRGTCATFAALGLMERYTRGDLSEQCVVREIGGNDGAGPADRLELLTTKGAIQDSSCRYDPLDQTVNIPAGFNYESMAKTLSGRQSPTLYRRIAEGADGYNSIAHMKDWIDAGHPTTIAIMLPDESTFFDGSTTSRVDVPPSMKCNGVPIETAQWCPSHLVIVVGYDDADQSLLIKNSWGTWWKDGGYGRVSYATFARLGYGTIDGVRRLGREVPGSAPHAGDFDGDGKADMAVYRPSTGAWYSQQSKNGGKSETFGGAPYVAVPGDYDGDGWSDLATWDPSNGLWSARGSMSGPRFMYLGGPGDIPLPNDYDGDGRTDAAVYHPSTATFEIVMSGVGGKLVVPFGKPNEIPVPADYDADGKVDVAVFDPQTGDWQINGSEVGIYTRNYGQAGDIPAPGDYDGDRFTDLAVFRPSTGQWMASRSRAGNATWPIGGMGDIPVPSDYDGDGTTDIAVYNKIIGGFTISYSAAGVAKSFVFGDPTDIPVSSVLYPH